MTQPAPQRQVYCISGLGADERIFSKLNVPGACFHYLQWLQPDENEPIGHYASRMIQQLPSPDPVSPLIDSISPLIRQVPAPGPVLLGVSFGGMMAIEMAKLYPAACVILVSSVRSHHELPPWMKLCRKLKLVNSLPRKPWRWARLENYFLGTETPEELTLSNEFRMHADPDYVHWALGQVVNWPNDWQPSALYHIHGSKDKMFPVKYVSPTNVIPGGGHFMIMNRAQEVNATLTRILTEIRS
jgi:pimeloyl-ACP methyl ester carboxylesterase